MGKTYAFTDVHGQYDLWQQIKEYCAEDDTIYFLGDAIDRGPDGLKIMMELLEDPRVTYVCGNHEDLMRALFPEFLEGDFRDLQYYLQQGGKETWEEFQKLSKEKQIELFYAIDRMPIEEYYRRKDGIDIVMTHSGACDFTHKWITDHLSLWDRSHLDKQWWREKENVVIIHGHSPVQSFFKKSVPVRYCDKHKIDLDLGSFDSKQIALINLDDFDDIKIFTERK